MRRWRKNTKKRRFRKFTAAEQAALHHALWSGWENATPSPFDTELVYPKDVHCICMNLLEELDVDPATPNDKDIPYTPQTYGAHSSRGHNPAGWSPPDCK